MTLEQRVSRLEGAYEQVDGRLSDISSSMDSLRADMNGLRAEVNNLRSETTLRFDNMQARIDQRFNSLYILMAGMWVTIMGALIGIALVD